MPEPQDNPGGSPNAHEEVLAFTPPALTPAERALLHPHPEPTDDTPTIISKPVVGVARAEETFAQGLRGRRLAHFELLEPIGVGGMAAVIRARDTQLDRQVALKILPPEMAVDPENIRRFHQEARSAARLDHENIARVFFCGGDQGLHFIAFEFVEGENLRALLDRRGPLPIPEAVHYLLQITLGLAHASARGVVHRDIKPSNIIVTPDGRAKLVDMGLARSLHPVPAGELTHSGVTLGTFDYISPEQALEPREADVRSDIYSLGCTFYQVLTGRSPVPEGTAAKKLHHHHYVPPLDPRQLNPAIPDELAAILSHMMAKDPRDRYQDPLHLAKQVDDLARRLGVPSEVPDYVRAMYVPRPGLRSHPLRFAGIAGLLLVLVVALHALLSGPVPGPRTPQAAWLNEAPGKIEPEPPARIAAEQHPAEVKAESPAAPPVEHPAPHRLRVATAEQFAAALRESRNHPETIIDVSGVIDLTPRTGSETASRPAALTFDGPGQLTIQPCEELVNGQPPPVPIVRFHYQLDMREGAALTVKGGKVVIKGIRFEVDAHQADVTLAALRVQDAGQLSLRDCEFIQANTLPTPQRGRLSAVALEGSAEQRPQLEASNCIFRHGPAAREGTTAAQDAIALAGHARVRLSSCAFGPHHAIVHLQERSVGDVALHQCSAFLLGGAAFLVEERAAFGGLRVTDSVFSRPVEETASAGATAAVFRFAGDSLPEFHFAWRRNGYHNLGAFGVRGEEKWTWTQFQQLRDVHDDGSQVLTKWPWSQLKPLEVLDDNQPQRAFALEVDHPELRQGSEMIGCQGFAGHRLYNTPLLPPDERSLSVRTVDPSQETEGNRYKSLAEAVAASRPGDTIVVQHNGPLRIEPVVEKGPLDLTIKAAEGYHPILSLRGTREAEAVLFRVYDGELHFEKLEFLLRPRQRNFRESQSVVGISGAGRCAFTDCVVTLDGGEAEAALSVVALADPSKVMAPDAERPAPRPMPAIAFTNGFVRGRGDFLSVPASRAFDLKLANALVALDGSCVRVGPNPAETPADALSAQVALDHVTTYLTGQLLQFRTARNKADLVPLRVAPASHCLFAAATGQPLVHIGGDLTDDQLRRLSWQGEQNAYSNYPLLLDQQVKNDEMMMGMTEPYKRPRWETFTGETGSRFDPVRFTGLPPGESALARAAVNQFKVAAETDWDFGADLARLPVPTSDKAPASSTRAVD